MSIRSVTIGAMALATAVLLGCILWRTKHPTLGPDFQSSNAFKYWSSLKYVPIDSALGPNKSLALKDNAHAKGMLDSEQSKDLESLGGRFLLAYSTANYDNFFSFRFPTTNFHFLGEYIPNVRKMMQANGVSSNETMAELDVFKWWWHFAIQSNQNSCAKCWQQIAVDSPQIVRVQKATNALTSLSQDISANISFEPTIFPSSICEFNDSPDDIIKRQGYVLVSVLAVTLKESSGAYRPAYLESYWSDQAKRWLPRYLGIGQYGGDSPIFCF